LPDDWSATCFTWRYRCLRTSPKWLASSANEAAEKTPDSKTADSQAGSAAPIPSDRSGVSARNAPTARPCRAARHRSGARGKNDQCRAASPELWRRLRPLIAERRSATWPAICAPLAALLPFRMRSNRHAQGCPVDCRSRCSRDDLFADLSIGERLTLSRVRPRSRAPMPDRSKQDDLRIPPVLRERSVTTALHQLRFGGGEKSCN